MTNEIGDIMRRLRAVKGYSQQEVSALTGINETTYSRYERGETLPKMDAIIALCKLYNITLNEFFLFNTDLAATVKEEREPYLKKLTIPIMVMLDGTEETLAHWLNKLRQINGAI